MLIDIALRDKRTIRAISPEVQRRIRRALNDTKRYSFDTAASDKLFELAVGEPETVCEFADTAIPPFKNTYIEVDYSRHPARKDWMINPNDPPTNRVGFLYCEDGCVFILSGDERFAFFTPFVYIDIEKAAAILNADVSRLIKFVRDKHDPSSYEKMKALLMVGINPVHKRYNELRPLVHKLTDRFELGISWDLNFLPRKLDDDLAEVLTKQAEESSGSLRIATASILLLNERRVTNIYEKRAGSRMLHSKLVPLPAYNEVVIDLDAKFQTFHKLFSEGPKVRQRFHEVSGYWCYYDCASQCQHQWVEYRSEAAEKRDLEKHNTILKRQICTLCGGRRTRKPEYTKGSKDLGIVKKTYKVTASQHRRKAK